MVVDVGERIVVGVGVPCVVVGATWVVVGATVGGGNVVGACVVDGPGLGLGFGSTVVVVVTAKAVVVLGGSALTYVPANGVLNIISSPKNQHVNVMTMIRLNMTGFAKPALVAYRRRSRPVAQ